MSEGTSEGMSEGVGEVIQSPKGYCDFIGNSCDTLQY